MGDTSNIDFFSFKVDYSLGDTSNILIALTCSAVMSMPFTLQSGIIFDTRSILISVLMKIGLATLNCTEKIR